MLVVLTDTPNNIAARLQGRDGLFPDISFIDRMQVAEKEHAEMVGEMLGIEVIEKSINDADELVARIKQIL